MLRVALKSSFPRVKFSVRSKVYAGGASIGVVWTDGPTEARVKAVTHLYTGASVAPMDDLVQYHNTVLGKADGSIESVHFGADFIATVRRFSREFLEDVAGEVAAEYGIDPVKVQETPHGAYVESTGSPVFPDGLPYQDAAWYVTKAAERREGPIRT